MAVLIEGISVVVPNRILESRYPGGARGYMDAQPGLWRCSDGNLTCAGFMHPDDVKAHDRQLTRHGIFYEVHRAARDAVVVDMREGSLRPCAWLDFRHAKHDGQLVASARLCGS